MYFEQLLRYPAAAPTFLNYVTTLEASAGMYPSVVHPPSLSQESWVPLMACAPGFGIQL